MTVLLDVDNVIFNWRMHSPNIQNSWDDWTVDKRAPKDVYFHSPKMIDMINGLFGDRIEWLSIWGREQKHLEELSLWTNLCLYPSFTDKIKDVIPQDFIGSGMPIIEPSLYIPSHNYDSFDPRIRTFLLRANSWKLNAVTFGIIANFLPGKVIWVDASISRFRTELIQILSLLDVKDRFLCHIPFSCWLKSDIVKAYDWYYYDKPFK